MMRFLTLALAVVLGGCATHSMQFTESPGRSVPTVTEARHFYFMGIGQEYNTVIRDVCGSRTLARVELQKTFKDVVWTGLTLGVYTPHTVSYYCTDADN